MRHVNAQIKTIQEARARLEAGETFWLNGSCISYDEEYIYNGLSPYRCKNSALKDYWYYYAEWKVKVEWYDNITKPVFCWVSNSSPSDRDIAVWICEKVPDSPISFKAVSGQVYNYATPVQVSDLLKETE